ncbi:MAG: homoserine O-succinyltransferase [Gammaproteobacteria bacterium]|nr:homoserine O-succinyltransferase [Gammaproteobacteria bacterium]MBU1723711.1 homoserine O-succinyltransferase [Gammaproteobacteria bacterium]MBU2004795.1 homoserine O-succinyltransferase [Gammaproteobacteria bacterium]
MPLVAHTGLPTFERLRQEGQTILSEDYAFNQDIRELHIGFLNMMPDAALEATERQFFRLVNESNLIAQFHIHPFTLDTLPRGEKAQQHIARYYDKFADLQEQGLDALIITGANPAAEHLEDEPFWDGLCEVAAWAQDNVTSTLCSCLSSHALVQHLWGIRRRPLGYKRWGVYDHAVTMPEHPLVNDLNTRFDVPHSRFNQIDRGPLEAVGVQVLVESEEAGVHMAVSPDLFRMIFLQGHPEYDAVSLLKEYRREVTRWFQGTREDYPPFPQNYLRPKAKAILNEYRLEQEKAKRLGNPLPDFPEKLLLPMLHNTWRDTAKVFYSNWIGKVYQLTNNDRQKPFMDGVDPDDPLGLRKQLGMR